LTGSISCVAPDEVHNHSHIDTLFTPLLPFTGEINGTAFTRVTRKNLPINKRPVLNIAKAAMPTSKKKSQKYEGKRCAE
jgi:hypothetical protein